jgi:Tfp pilus assembly protein PilN
MKDLDFLPARYQAQNAIHKARLCQLAMSVAFGAIICLAACFQFALYRSAKQGLASIAPQHDDAVNKTTQLAALRAEVEQSRQFAKLYTFLKYPWPRTQMLADITKDLPPEVTLRELTIVEEIANPFARTGVTVAGVTSKPAVGETPPKSDLALLRSQLERSRSEIQISGTTTDAGALHLFVMALNGTPLFESAKLHSMEAMTGSEQAKSKFLIRLTVRPGYGQSGGPQAPPAIASQVNQIGSIDRS